MDWSWYPHRGVHDPPWDLWCSRWRSQLLDEAGWMLWRQCWHHHIIKNTNNWSGHFLYQNWLDEVTDLSLSLYLFFRSCRIVQHLSDFAGAITFLFHYNRFRIRLTDGSFTIERNYQPGNWTHVVFTFLGPDNGVKLFLDGALVQMQFDKVTETKSPGDGRLVIGRHLASWNQNYGSVDLDELLLFNANLTEDEVPLLSAHV